MSLTHGKPCKLVLKVAPKSASTTGLDIGPIRTSGTRAPAVTVPDGDTQMMKLLYFYPDSEIYGVPETEFPYKTA